MEPAVREITLLDVQSRTVWVYFIPVRRWIHLTRAAARVRVKSRPLPTFLAALSSACNLTLFHPERRILLLCPAVLLLILINQGDIYCHRRTATKRVFPSMYDMFIGGISGSMEPSVLTAARELGEELGLGPLAGGGDSDRGGDVGAGTKGALATMLPRFR